MNQLLFLFFYISIIGAMLSMIVGMIGGLFDNDSIHKWAFGVMFCCCGLALIVCLIGLLTSFPFAV